MEAEKLNVPAADLVTEPLTVEELHEAATKRISLIQKELTDGFEFLKNYPRSVTFFGSSRCTEDSEHYKQARGLAAKIVEELGYAIFTGGGPGIMEAANRGAKEAGGKSLGLNINLLRAQRMNPYVTDHASFYYFFSRKLCLAFSAEAYIFFPGGYGTLDEFFEILTLVQTGKMARVPILAVGRDFWEPMKEFIYRHIYTNHCAIEKTDMNLFVIADNNDEIIKLIGKTPIRNGIPFHY
ncbi:MAG: TIGR00730 family Rossman fold protein [bacterium]|nr:TIGR00730 family Rossman fold protein [bacterium]